MKRLLIITLLFACFSVTFSQQWINNFNHVIGGLKTGEDKAYAITVDDLGFTYIAGFVTSYDSKYDLVTAKISPDGQIVWAETYNGGGNLSDKAYAITVDDLDNVYVTGFTTDINENINIITIKYSPEGTPLWIKFYDGTAHGEDKAYAIRTDESDNVYVAGSTQSTNNGLDYILIKYNSSGLQQWVKTYNGSGNDLDAVTSMVIDGNNNPVITGYSRSTHDEGSEHIVTIKYNPNGAELWSNSYLGNSGLSDLQDKAYAITVDKLNNIFVTGSSVQSGGHGKDIVTICYSPNGIRKWAETWNNSDNGNGDDIAYSIAVTDNNNVVVCGSTLRNDHEDFVTLDYHSNNGNLKWSDLYGSNNGNDIAYSLVLSNSGNEVFVTGTSQVDPPLDIYDLVTIKYKIANGDKLELAEFNNTGIDKTFPIGAVVDGSDNLIIAGYVVPNASNRPSSHVYENSSIFALKYSSTLTHGNHNNVTAPEAKSTKLYQNFPNPFNPTTQIRFYLPSSASVKLTVYDMLGKEIGTLVNSYMDAGEHSALFDGDKLSSGIYLYVLNVNGIKEIKKMILVK